MYQSLNCHRYSRDGVDMSLFLNCANNDLSLLICYKHDMSVLCNQECPCYICFNYDMSMFNHFKLNCAVFILINIPSKTSPNLHAANIYFRFLWKTMKCNFSHFSEKVLLQHLCNFANNCME